MGVLSVYSTDDAYLRGADDGCGLRYRFHGCRFHGCRFHGCRFHGCRFLRSRFL
ncbi:MAG: pentapeptide repeat-containing protein [Lachnospiraceae bacterium]|nr:pentapeptide repeat-containing protein [Lachnospiraceae bacterium]